MELVLGRSGVDFLSSAVHIFEGLLCGALGPHFPSIQKMAQHRARLGGGRPDGITLSRWQDLALIHEAAPGDGLAAAALARHRPPRPLNSLLVPLSTRLSSRSA